jgi:hypothetical protein
MKVLLAFMVAAVMIFVVMRRRSLALSQVLLFGLCLTAAALYYVFNQL